MRVSGWVLNDRTLREESYLYLRAEHSDCACQDSIVVNAC